METSRERSTKLRWFIGLLVLIAVIVILGLKNASESPLIALSEDDPAVGTGVPLDPTPLEQEPGVVQTDAPVIEPTEATREVGQSERGRAHDVLYMLFLSIKRQAVATTEIRFTVYFLRTPAGKPRPVSLKFLCGPGDQAEPVITIMLPNED